MNAQPPKSGNSSAAAGDRLQGLVERVTFHSAETGFCVLRVKARGWRELATVVGTLPEVRAGEWIAAEGKWVVDSEHGQQLKAHTLKTTRPDTADGIRKYLASGLIKGIGPTFAGRLVDAFGEGVFDVTEQEPERLETLDGIGPKRRERITTAWAEQRAVREIIPLLHEPAVCRRAPRGDEVEVEPHLHRRLDSLSPTAGPLADLARAKDGGHRRPPPFVRAGYANARSRIAEASCRLTFAGM